MSEQMLLTSQGAALMAKIAAGDGTVPLKITRVVSSSGYVLDPLNATELVTEELTYAILSSRTDGPRTILELSLTNIGNPAADIPPLARGYLQWQVGMFAEDPDLGEILFRIQQFENPLYIPPANESGFSFTPVYNIVTGNATDVVVNVDVSGMATLRQVWDSIELSDSDTPKSGTRMHAYIAEAVSNWDVLVPHQPAAGFAASLRMEDDGSLHGGNLQDDGGTTDGMRLKMI